MINATLYERGQKNTNFEETDLTSRLVTPLQITEQLDVTLDSGEMNYLIAEEDTDGLREPLAIYELSVNENFADLQRRFVGIDSRALLRKGTLGSGIYSHKVSLVEAAKLLQGVLIDGVAVTQPEDESQRKTLYDVVVRALRIAQFDNAQQAEGAFSLHWSAPINVLQSTKSPQFKWNTQTTLWECLEQVGAVMDAIPTLEIHYNDADQLDMSVSFEFVNATGNEAASIVDEYANVIGENVDESQYNTALGSVVENLRENE
ncbi:MAG: hypothetical protein NC132_05545 [Corallococcus sp.]|nr:hypothetical protein [Corallococcus sp.]MCM1360000.1 hypothetical protein [Corallococcus sp.]MCM1395557.1 hypothetical protein [Corallococcus sp.]